jgi:hypothetical protein
MEVGLNNIKTYIDMKRIHIYGFFLLLTGFLLVCFNSCKDEDSYNFNAIFPKLIGGISGLNSPIGHGLTAYPYTYSVVHRGGSTYEWIVDGSDATIVQDNNFGSIARITFAVAADTTDAEIKVVETTMGGIVSDTAILAVQILPYCPLDLDQFVGTYTEDDDTGETTDVEITRDPADPLFGLIINGVLSEPNNWFGEPGGTLKIRLNGCDNSVDFDSQNTGIVYAPYGAVSMRLTDNAVKGTFDPVSKEIKFDGEVFVSAGSFGTYIFTYTKH